MREKVIERHLAVAVKKLGGMAVKFVSPGLDGVPDRIILLPSGKIAFVELKATGKKLRALQEKRKRQLEALGFPVYVIDGLEQIRGVLDEICATGVSGLCKGVYYRSEYQCFIFGLWAGKDGDYPDSHMGTATGLF